MIVSMFIPAADPVSDARRILLDAVETYGPSHVFGLLSGGNDSACACHVAASVLGDRFSGVAHINTETGVRETREHVDRLCKAFGWTLNEYRPPLPKWGREGETAYDAIVRRYGFPGPAQHTKRPGSGAPGIYNLLKERCVRQLMREHGGGRVLLVTGARLAESTIRMGRVDESVREGRRVWVAPIIRWESWDKDIYMREHGIPRNPVTEKLGISGECLCGCYACPGEFARIALHYPDAAEAIWRRQAMAEAAGVPCMWGERPPEREKHDPAQTSMFGLCWSCGTKAERRSA